ncbi:MAG: metallophosphoesterase [Burkholderiales bacterium]|nr:metallophosphoesterase [Burkholderiales bacterium]
MSFAMFLSRTLFRTLYRLISVALLSSALPLSSALAADAVTVYAAGDIADCRDTSAANSDALRTAKLLQPLLQQDPQARVLTLGDNTYPVGAPSEFRDCYQPTWGQFKSRTHPSPGNHDYYTAQGAGYYDYFGELAGPQKRGYYRVQIGSWQVFSLNSNLKGVEQKDQIAWLKQELAANPARCTLAYWHHPVFSSGGHGNSSRMQAVWDTLAAANADLVLVGHDHDYERFAPQDPEGKLDPARGIAQFVVGTGGSGLSPFGMRRANSEKGQNEVHGVLKLVLKDDGYDWQFLAVDATRFQDKGSAACH